jgi:hypothetical protein
MRSVRNGGKDEREQHFEGLTVVSLVMCSRWNGWGSRLNCGAYDGKGGTTAPQAADGQNYRTNPKRRD